MSNTIKVGTTGRFNARYGVGVRKRVLAVERKTTQATVCPFCGFAKTRREAAGLFLCGKCDAKFTGGAYEPQTLVGKTINKMVSQKQFMAGVAELAKTTESSFSDIEREVEKALTATPADAPAPEEKKSKKKKAKDAEVTIDEVPAEDAN